ncbi:MAG: hypothetical protein SOR92_03995 [Christensenella hongkongensis]|uniref:hypothetical protein n=1 Tax=Christensenella hongkongensis TaxID=270498 RepID=UPI00104B0D88|nr:hypothetical protein [Christensenella hongkongensis]MDY3003610.1 hypothetical protein [Christensenella hongkongensis]TCW29731.1 hypothetical protein EV208_10469 [Christensenella hongkongensis]
MEMCSVKAERNNDEAAWKAATALLQDFLKLTEEISTLLTGEVDEPGDVEKKLDERAEIIRKIQGLNLRTDDGDAGQEVQKHRWLYGQLLEKIEKAEDANKKRLSEIMQQQMKQMRETTRSIRTIDAYNKQMQEVEMPDEQVPLK